MFVFDWTITLGNLATIVGFFGAGLAFVLQIRSDLHLLSYRISNMEDAIKALADTEIAIAKQETWRTAFDERMDVLTTRLDQHINFSLESLRKINSEKK